MINEKIKKLIESLEQGNKLTLQDFTYILENYNKEDFDYIKVGPYIKHLGPLKSSTTNQRLYRRLMDGTFEDITYRFWRRQDMAI